MICRGKVSFLLHILEITCSCDVTPVLVVVIYQSLCSENQFQPGGQQTLTENGNKKLLNASLYLCAGNVHKV